MVDQLISAILDGDAGGIKSVVSRQLLYYTP
jgi:hypothetical protein